MVTALAGFFAAFVLIFMRIPIALSLALVGLCGFAYITNWNPAFAMMANSVRDSSMTYGLSVIPLFILMGNLVAGTGVSAELYRAAQAFFGHRRGGLAVATIVSCGGFAAVCGSSIATTVTMGRVALPSMRAYKYDDGLITGSISAGATLGILIPPSVIMVIYGIVTETHIGKLYAAGLIPGVLGIILYAAAVKWVVWRNASAAPIAERANLRERLESLRHIWPVVALFALVLGGIYGGVFSATEAAGLGASGALLLSILRRNLSLASLYAILLDTAQTTAVIFSILMGATAFTEFLNLSGVHHTLLDLVTANDFSPAAVIAVIILIYLVLGCLMESISMILITVPMFFPIVVGLGFDPVWFGVLLVVVVEVGLITPPIGVNLFVVRAIAPDVPMARIIRGIIPFISADLIRIVLIATIPALSLFLPELFFSR